MVELAERIPALVASDDRLVRRLVTLVLEIAGYCVESVATGDEALTRLRQSGSPMLAFLDLGASRLNSAAVFQQIATDDALADRHAYVLLTANREGIREPYAALLRHLNVVVLAKPFAVDDALAAASAATHHLAVA